MSFANLSDDQLRSLANAMAEVGRKAAEKARRKRNPRAAWKEPGDFSPTRSVSTGALDQIGGVATSPLDTLAVTSTQSGGGA